MFDNSEKGPFEVPTVRTKKDEQYVPGGPKLYVLQGRKSCCVLFSLSYYFNFFGGKISAGCFKDEITPSLKSNNRLKFYQDVAMNRAREKGE